MVARDLVEARQATAVILRRDTSDACLASSRSRATDSTRFVPDMGPDTAEELFCSTTVRFEQYANSAKMGALRLDSNPLLRITVKSDAS